MHRDSGEPIEGIEVYVSSPLIGDNTYHTDEDGFVYTGLSMPPNEIDPEDEFGGKYTYAIEVNTDEYYVYNQSEPVSWNSDIPIIMYVYD